MLPSWQKLIKPASLQGKKQKSVNYKKQHIHRKIQVDSLEEIDFQNLGVHFTADSLYEHKGGGYSGLTPQKKYVAHFIVEPPYEVNQEATEESNFNYPKEREVVLMPNQQLKATLKVYDSKSMQFQFFTFKGTEVNINTGTRMDKWVENFI